MRIVFLFFFLVAFSALSEGQIAFREHPDVQRLMDYYTKTGVAEEVIDGWRIKIISTTDRRALENAKYLFETNYPEYVCTQHYEAPQYSLKVGAFETRLDVEPLLATFKADFPLAIPFRDRIFKSELF